MLWTWSIQPEPSTTASNGFLELSTLHKFTVRLTGTWLSNRLTLGLDFTSQSLLCSATAPNASSKVKILELFNPSMTVELKYTGTLSFRWAFKFEECVYG